MEALRSSSVRVAAFLIPVLLVAGCNRRPTARTPAFGADALALVGVTVIDGNGGAPRPGQTVVVGEGRIVAVADAADLDVAGARVVDGAGKFLMPAMWDTHGHTFAQSSTLDLYLTQGIGFVRDLGCSPECAQALLDYRAELEAGSAMGPRLIVSGPNVDGRSVFPGYDGHVWVTEETAAEVVARLEAAGSDLIKVRDWLTLEQYRAVVAAAREVGLPVDGHVAAAVPALEALASGQRTIEHAGSALGGLLLACSSEEDELRAELLRSMETALQGGPAWAVFVRAQSEAFLRRVVDTFDEAKAAALVEAFVANGAALSPTLVVLHPAFSSSDPVFDGRRLREDEASRYFPPGMIEQLQARGQQSPYSEADRAARAESSRLFADLILKLHEAGVPIVAGTDAAMLPIEPSWLVPGFSLHDELLLLVEAGLTPLEAISSATRVPAEVFGLDETLGTIEVGKSADLVLLSADPTADIRNTRKIEAVVSAGQLLEREDLDHILERVAIGARGEALRGGEASQL